MITGEMCQLDNLTKFKNLSIFSTELYWTKYVMFIQYSDLLLKYMYESKTHLVNCKRIHFHIYISTKGKVIMKKWKKCCTKYQYDRPLTSFNSSKGKMKNYSSEKYRKAFMKKLTGASMTWIGVLPTCQSSSVDFNIQVTNMQNIKCLDLTALKISW